MANNPYGGYGLEPLEELNMNNPSCGEDAHFQHLKHYFAGYRSAITNLAEDVDESPHHPDGAKDISWRAGYTQGRKDLMKKK